MLLIFFPMMYSTIPPSKLLLRLLRALGWEITTTPAPNTTGQRKENSEDLEKKCLKNFKPQPPLKTPISLG